MLSLKLLPALLIGTLLSKPLSLYMDAGWMRPAMLVLCAAASALLLIRALSGDTGATEAALAWAAATSV